MMTLDMVDMRTRPQIPRYKRMQKTATPLPLENGDRLTRLTFRERYDHMPHIKKAELIKGVVYMDSPVRYVAHGEPHFQIIAWLSSYTVQTPGLSAGDNASLVLDDSNEPQPDVLLRVKPEYGGQSTVDENGYLTGPVELVIEIAASTASYDVNDKKSTYQDHGIQEYIVWRTLEYELDWWHLVNGEYQPLEPDEAGIIRSQVFPGLWLAVDDLIEGDMGAVIREAQNGLKSEEYQAFLKILERMKQ